MPDDESNAEASLRKLGRRLHQGWERLQPVTQNELEKVREAVRKQWEQEQKPAQGTGQEQAPPDQGHAQSREQTATEQESDQTRTRRPPDKSRGHDHEQSQ